MGIKGLLPWIKKHAPSAVTTQKLSDFKGQQITIDASDRLYVYAYDIKNKKRNSHLAGFYSLIMRMYTLGIQPILVFDGAPPALKHHVIEQRKADREAIISELQTLKQQGAPEAEMAKLTKKLIIVTPTMSNDVKHLANLMHTQWIQAPSEADMICGRLGCPSWGSDGDLLIHGVPKLIRGQDWSDELEVIDLNVALKSLNINLNQLRQLAVLAGCDYTQDTIKGIGLKHGFDLIKKYGTIDNIVQAITLGDLTDFNVPSSQDDFPYQEAVELFTYSGDTISPPPKLHLIQPNEINHDELVEYMSSQCGYRPQTIRGHLEKWRLLTAPKLKLKLKLKLKTN
jgi:5'-3' exonuclease